MRLIDADALEESLENSCKDTYETKMFVDFMNYVDESPTIEQSEDCVSRKSVVEWLERCTDDSIEHAIDTNLDFIPSVTPSYNSIKTELKPCEDCISREEAIRIAEQGQIQGYEWQFKKLCNLPSVTPSIPDVENNFNLGYNCGYADAMSDTAESEE